VKHFFGFLRLAAAFFPHGRVLALLFLTGWHQLVWGNTGEWAAIDAGFSNPPAEYRLIQFSGHDGAALPVSQMNAAGIGGVQLYMQTNGYLQTAQAWANVSNNITALKSAGMQVWMTDENGYPSGMAGGRVVEANPAHESRCLISVSTNGRGSNPPISLSLPAGAEKFVHAYIYTRSTDDPPVLSNPQAYPVQTNLVSGSGISGRWSLRAFALQVNNSSNQATSTAAGFGHNGTYPNLLDAAAADSFVLLTHDQYAQRFGPLQGKIDAFYANEPNLMTLWWSGDPTARPNGVTFLPWSTSLPARFQLDHGYSLLPLLPALYEGTDADSKRVRRHFYQTVGNMFSENFSQRIANWAAAQGIGAAGHPLQEEDLYYHVIHYGDLFRFVEPLQIPACDLPMPDRGAEWNCWMPKFLSSVSQFKNRTTVAGLLDPLIYRPIAQLTPLPDHFRRIVNMAAFSGVNQFQTYLFWYQYPAALYRGMNEYVGRLSLVLRGARNAATVGVYYPIETFQANFLPVPDFWTQAIPAWETMRSWQIDLNNTATHLARAAIDFNWLHGDWIRDATIENGYLVIGSHRYAAIVLPRTEVLPLAVATKLQQFEQAGGKIVLVTTRPTMGDAASEDAAVAGIFAGRTPYSASEVPGQLGMVLPPDFVVSVTPPAQTGTEQEFFHARFLRDGRRIHYLVNNSASSVTPALSLTHTNVATLSVAVYNPLNGSVTSRQLPGSLTVVPFSSLLVVENPAVLPTSSYPTAAPALAVVNGNFSDLLGTNRVSADWFSGFPQGWSGGTNATYAIATLNGTAYANLGTLTTGGGFRPILQTVGTVQTTSDLHLHFSLTNLNANPASTVGVAFYGPNLANLGNTNVTGAGTFTHIVRNVSAGTPVQIAFWGTSSGAPMGLTAVSVSSTTSSGNVSVADGGVLELSAVSPASITGNLVFGVGAKVRVTGTPSGPAVLLMSVAGLISGTPSLESPVAGYRLVAGGRWLWLRADGSSPLALFNGNFDILTGMTGPLASVWYGGYPLGWTSGVAATDYSIYANGGLYYANLNTLGNSAATSLRQNIGTLELNSDVTLSFQVANPFPNSPNNSMGAAIFPDGSTTALATYSLPSLSGVGASTNVVLKALGVPAGTALSVGFWNTGGTAPAVRSVSVTSTPLPYDAWFSAYGLDPATTGSSGADPDGDSLSNAVEYAFGTSPVHGAGEVLKTAASGGQFTIQWLQRTDGATTYAVQETASLSSSWTNSSALVQSGSGPTPPTGYEWRKITVPVTDRKFYRVNAVLSP
jgi:hypothetical protein